TASFLGGLSATPSDRSRIINVRFVSTDPKMSALAVNTVAETYIRLQLEVKGEATNRAAIWLNERVNELRLRVLDSQARLEEIRARSGVFQVGGASNMQRDLLDLNNQLMQARAKRAESDARHRQVQQILKAGGDIDSIAAVLDSQLIQRLREQEAVVLRKSGELKTQLRENHPRMLLADAELSDLRQKIAAEVNRIALGMGSDLQLAKVRETNLQIEVDALQKRLDDQAQAEAQVRTLESEVKTNTQLYETILQRFKETNVIDESTQQADARIINRATVPDQPFYPNKKMMIVAALIVSAVIGMALAFMLEFLDGGFRSLSQLEAQTGLPTLGLVPITDGKKRRSRRPHEIALDRPNSSYGEAIRSLRTGILLSNVDQPPRTVLITSSVPGEGKSSTSLSLAATSAKSGQRTIIIDCDLRHSSLHVYLDAPNQIGLSDFLAGQASLEDVIEIDPRSGVHYITAGGRTPNPTDLLASEEMKKLIRRLGQLYDLVVLDTPPLLAVSDALVLVRSVDKALFLVRWEKTRRETALAGIKQIVDSGADLAGIVLTQVDTKRHAQYDYSDSGYYHYGGYKKYYAE
ncbi:MAG: polysaccharide biosynthesis tyrosine autokinase, partial [Rhodospirillales bacterium]|nr:polysaccharide biosynthesis tyrosine autokinase [Rhodospirillales bacterium]